MQNLSGGTRFKCYPGPFSSVSYSTLKIVRNVDGQVLYEQDMTIMPEGQFSLMQLSDTDFLDISDGEEADPESRHILKFVSFILLMPFPAMTS